MESSESNGPAIRALKASSLFKLKVVYLWDDDVDVVSTKTPQLPFSHDSPQDCQELSSNNPDLAVDFGLVPEDVQLTEQMNALGLPLAFQSNKKTKAKMCKSKRKGSCQKHSLSIEKVMDEAELLAKVSGMEVVSPIALHDKTDRVLSCVSMTGQSEQSYSDILVEVGECPFPTGDDYAISTNVLCDDIIRQIRDMPCDDISNNGQGWESLHGDVASEDDNGEGITSCTSETILPTGCHLRDGDVDHSEKDLNRITVEDDGLDHCSDNGENICKGVEHAGVSEMMLLEGSEMLDVVDNPNHGVDIGDWRVFWDPFYKRNYFYNLKSETSTWIPPPGIEHQALGHFMDEANEGVAEVMGIDDCPPTSCAFLSYSESFEESLSGGALVDQFIDGVGGVVVGKVSSTLCKASPKGNDKLEHGHEIPIVELSGDDDLVPLSEVLNIGRVITEVTESGDMETEVYSSAMKESDAQLVLGVTKLKKKARKKQKKSHKDHQELQFQGMIEGNLVNISKYWHQRYRLFSRYDDGIKMDEEGWFSVTPEAIAKHHAEQCANDVVIDCFAGVGGNSIQFARRCKHVTAIDIDPSKINYAYHNAAIYGVNEQIDFIKGDFFALAPRLKADVVFLSPPWGGPDYAKAKTYDIKTMLKPQDGYFLFDIAKQIANRVIIFLPKNTDLNQLAELSLSSSPPWSLKVEKNYLNGKFKAITAYFSDTA